LPLAKAAPADAKVLGDEDIATLFGLDMGEAVEPAAPTPAVALAAPRKHRKTAGDSTALAATTAKRPTAARGKTPTGTIRKVPAGPVRNPSTATTTKSPAAATRHTTMGTARKTPASTTWKAPVVTKTAAAKPSNLSRATRVPVAN
jgi:hypothetical protein